MEPLEALPYLSKKVINFAHKQNLLIQYSEGIFSSYERAVTMKLLLERQKTMLVLTAPWNVQFSFSWFKKIDIKTIETC